MVKVIFDKPNYQIEGKSLIAPSYGSGKPAGKCYKDAQPGPRNWLAITGGKAIGLT